MARYGLINTRGRLAYSVETTVSDSNSAVASLARWELSKVLESSNLAHREADGAVTVKRSQQAGCLLYGPYWQLKKGTYCLRFRAEARRMRWQTQPLFGVEVIVLNRMQQAWQDFSADELRGSNEICFVVTSDLSLESGNESRFEFRFFHFANADLKISSVELHKVDETSALRSAPRVLRLLSRLSKARIGERLADGSVRVSRQQRAGCLLYGGWPYLRLPRGGHRLSIVSDVQAETSSEPVLGVAIIGDSRWRSHQRPWLPPQPSHSGGTLLAWRDFTAAELRQTSVTIPFDVPLEMSLEAGRNSPFEFRLFHFGNSDLTITRIDLLRENGEEPVGQQSQWRLLSRVSRGSLKMPRWHTACSRASQYGWFTRPSFPLQLGQGRYKLQFQCRAADHGVRPLFRIRIIARKRRLALFDSASARQLGERDFVAKDLTDGSGELYFEVPADLAFGTTDAPSIEIIFDAAPTAGLIFEEVTLKRATRNPEVISSQAPAVLHVQRYISGEKKKLVIVGNCQSEIIRQGLAQIDAVTKSFDICYHFVTLSKQLYEYAKHDIENCDILLVQDIRDWEDFPLKNNIPSTAQVLRFPSVRFASLWPFDSWNGPGDKKAFEREAPNFTFPYRDGLLARMRTEIPNKQQRFLAYRSLEIEKLVNFKRLHELEVRRLLAMDQKFGIEIGSFILGSFRNERVFHTTVRPNKEIFNRLVSYVADLLGIRSHPCSLSDGLNALLMDPQVPVHPKVAAELGVKWANDRTMYLQRGSEVTWETYVRSYIDHYG